MGPLTANQSRCEEEEKASSENVHRNRHVNLGHHLNRLHKLMLSPLFADQRGQRPEGVPGAQDLDARRREGGALLQPRRDVGEDHRLGAPQPRARDKGDRKSNLNL